MSFSNVARQPYAAPSYRKTDVTGLTGWNSDNTEFGGFVRPRNVINTCIASGAYLMVALRDTVPMRDVMKMRRFMIYDDE